MPIFQTRSMPASSAQSSAWRRSAAAALVALSFGLPSAANAEPVVQFFDLGMLGGDLFSSLEVRAPGEYTDIFNFEVPAAAYSFAAAVGSFGVPTDSHGVTILNVTLFDQSFGVLDVDLDGSDGFVVEAQLPSAGLYRFAVNLSTLPSGGGYFIGVLPVITAVTEPASLPMVLAGMALVAGLSARQRPRVTAGTGA